MGINRRKFLKSVGLGTIMLGAQPLTALASEALVSDSSSQDRKDITDDGPQVQIGDHIAIADTEYGKVKGYIMRGIYTFLGIPYAADTSGKNRFMPPCKHKPWTGVRPAVFYGNTAPQDVYSRASTSYDVFVDHWNYDEISENCLCLNIWTQGIADGKSARWWFGYMGEALHVVTVLNRMDIMGRILLDMVILFIVPLIIVWEYSDLQIYQLLEKNIKTLVMPVYWIWLQPYGS